MLTAVRANIKPELWPWVPPKYRPNGNICPVMMTQCNNTELLQAATTEMQEWMKTTLATTGPRLGLFTSTSTLTVRAEQLGLVLALTRDRVRQKQVSATKYNYKQCTFTLVCIVIIYLYRR